MTEETPGDGSGLGERERAVLALERRSWPGPGAKERAVRERLGLSPTRYYQLLNALLDDPRALAHDPVTVNRLRRIREERDRELAIHLPPGATAMGGSFVVPAARYRWRVEWLTAGAAASAARTGVVEVGARQQSEIVVDVGERGGAPAGEDAR